MKKGTISLFLKLSIVLMGLIGVFACVRWFPFSVLYTVDASTEGSLKVTSEFWGQLSFLWACAVPCFWMLYPAWRVSDAFKNDSVFSTTTAKHALSAAKVLFADSAVFIVGNMLFYFLGINLFGILHAMIGAIGIIVAFMLYVLARYVEKAAALKEENDSIV